MQPTPSSVRGAPASGSGSCPGVRCRHSTAL